MKGGLVARDGGARPRMASQMQRILMSLSLVFVFESIVAILARILLFHFMKSVEPISAHIRRKSVDNGLTVTRSQCQTSSASSDNTRRCNDQSAD